ncbi:hypothetical protein SAMN05660473_03476 [Arthrobacter sp. 49Tsu3.1M3]|nr:hypothetical protein SAMN05660473_03476 [Arthrobacter sp. 49Tsu3.1M3]
MAIGSQRSRTAFRRAWLVCAGVAGAVLLSGCAGAPGSVPDTVFTAVKDSSSAVATARLALGLDASGKLTMAATATTLDDSLKELETARTSLLQLSPTVQNDRDLRREALAVLDEGISGLTTAQDAVASTDGSPTIQDGDQLLKAAAGQMSALTAQLGGQ